MQANSLPTQHEHARIACVCMLRCCLHMLGNMLACTRLVHSICWRATACIITCGVRTAAAGAAIAKYQYECCIHAYLQSVACRLRDLCATSVVPLYTMRCSVWSSTGDASVGWRRMCGTYVWYKHIISQHTDSILHSDTPYPRVSGLVFQQHLGTSYA
jgi:hypothetical protein